MNINITANKSDIYTEVQKLCAYVASKVVSEKAPAGSPQSIIVPGADDEQIETLWKQHTTRINDLLTKYIYSTNIVQVMTSTPESFTTDKLQLTLSMPDNIPDDMEALLNHYTYQYLIHAIASDWLILTQPDYAKLYAAQASTDYANLNSTTIKRKTPLVRPTGY